MSDQDVLWEVRQGDAAHPPVDWPDGCLQMILSSPPYWRLRDYKTGKWIGGDPACDHYPPNSQGKTGQRFGRTFTAVQPYTDICGKCGAQRQDQQIGLEATIEDYITKLVEVFRAWRRLLAPTGLLWLNIGDSFSNAGRAGSRGSKRGAGKPGWTNGGELGDKQLLLIPARVALALQSDGWILRNDIIWEKPNAMPSSVKDRLSTSYEHVFLFSKQKRYYYDAIAIGEPISKNTVHTYPQPDKAARAGITTNGTGATTLRLAGDGTRNARDVWTIATEASSIPHYAIMPSALARRCILAGSRPGDGIGDPFTGSGTTGAVAVKLGRRFKGSELNEQYCFDARNRIAGAVPYWQDARRVPAVTDLGPLFSTLTEDVTHA